MSAVAAAGEDLEPLYLDTLSTLARLQHRLLELIKTELEVRGYRTITAVQALLLYYLGKQEIKPAEVHRRQYYLGSNPSYNIDKLISLGLLSRSDSPADRRSVIVKATPRGVAVGEIVAMVYRRQLMTIESLGGLNAVDLATLNRLQGRFARFLNSSIAY